MKNNSGFTILKTIIALLMVITASVFIVSNSYRIKKSREQMIISCEAMHIYFFLYEIFEFNPIGFIEEVNKFYRYENDIVYGKLSYNNEEIQIKCKYTSTQIKDGITEYEVLISRPYCILKSAAYGNPEYRGVYYHYE